MRLLSLLSLLAFCVLALCLTTCVEAVPALTISGFPTGSVLTSSEYPITLMTSVTSAQSLEVNATCAGILSAQGVLPPNARNTTFTLRWDAYYTTGVTCTFTLGDAGATGDFTGATIAATAAVNIVLPTITIVGPALNQQFQAEGWFYLTAQLSHPVLPGKVVSYTINCPSGTSFTPSYMFNFYGPESGTTQTTMVILSATVATNQVCSYQKAAATTDPRYRSTVVQSTVFDTVAVVAPNVVMTGLPTGTVYSGSFYTLVFQPSTKPTMETRFTVSFRDSTSVASLGSTSFTWFNNVLGGSSQFLLGFGARTGVQAEYVFVSGDPRFNRTYPKSAAFNLILPTLTLTGAPAANSVVQPGTEFNLVLTGITKTPKLFSCTLTCTSTSAVTLTVPASDNPPVINYAYTSNSNLGMTVTCAFAWTSGSPTDFTYRDAVFPSFTYQTPPLPTIDITGLPAVFFAGSNITMTMTTSIPVATTPLVYQTTLYSSGPYGSISPTVVFTIPVGQTTAVATLIIPLLTQGAAMTAQFSNSARVSGDVRFINIVANTPTASFKPLILSMSNPLQGATAKPGASYQVVLSANGTPAGSCPLIFSLICQTEVPPPGGSGVVTYTYSSTTFLTIPTTTTGSTAETSSTSNFIVPNVINSRQQCTLRSALTDTLGSGGTFYLNFNVGNANTPDPQPPQQSSASSTGSSTQGYEAVLGFMLTLPIADVSALAFRNQLITDVASAASISPSRVTISDLAASGTQTYVEITISASSSGVSNSVAVANFVAFVKSAAFKSSAGSALKSADTTSVVVVSCEECGAATTTVTFFVNLFIVAFTLASRFA